MKFWFEDDKDYKEYCKHFNWSDYLDDEGNFHELKQNFTGKDSGNLLGVIVPVAVGVVGLITKSIFKK